jgi:hypothetical protein
MEVFDAWRRVHARMRRGARPALTARIGAGFGPFKHRRADGGEPFSFGVRRIPRSSSRASDPDPAGRFQKGRLSRIASDRDSL